VRGTRATQSNNVVLQRYCKGFDLIGGAPVWAGRLIDSDGEIVHIGRCGPL
jgi:hypothetical protein